MEKNHLSWNKYILLKKPRHFRFLILFISILYIISTYHLLQIFIILATQSDEAILRKSCLYSSFCIAGAVEWDMQFNLIFWVTYWRIQSKLIKLSYICCRRVLFDFSIKRFGLRKKYVDKSKVRHNDILITIKSKSALCYNLYSYVSLTSNIVRKKDYMNYKKNEYVQLDKCSIWMK